MTMEGRGYYLGRHSSAIVADPIHNSLKVASGTYLDNKMKFESIQ